MSRYVRAARQQKLQRAGRPRSQHTRSGGFLTLATASEYITFITLYSVCNCAGVEL